jgi:sortase A
MSKFISSNRNRRNVLLVIFLGILLFSAGYFYRQLQDNSRVVEIGDIEQKITDAQYSDSEHILPQIVIPSIGVSTYIQSVGFDQNGDMGVPSNSEDTAWFSEGPGIGSVGNAVVVGHVDSNNLLKNGVFSRLGELRQGDLVFVLTQERKKLTFRVDDFLEYETASAPRERIFGPTDDAQLNLVTCEGSWNFFRQNYSHRLVVYTRMIDESNF